MTSLGPIPQRTLTIRNAHPRLRVPRAAVRRAIAILDRDFFYLPADLPHLNARPFARATGGQSKIRNRKSAIQGGCPPGDLALVFLADPALARLHADFMGDPTRTDVITFEGDPAAGLAGDVCVSVDTAARYVGLRPGSRAAARQRAFAEELTLYLVHGWLHLAGYDDLRPARKRRMRLAERRALALLRAAGALPGFLLV